MNEPLARTMSAQLMHRIRRRILDGSYAPGAALLQDAIAAEFGVSKIPVREALVQLRSEGLIDVYAHRGFQVRPLSGSEAKEVFRLRLAIEPAAAAAGARLAEDEDRAAFETARSALDQAMAAGDLPDSGDLNAAFHISLVVRRRHPVTAEALQRLHTLSQRYVRLHLLPSGRLRRARHEHDALGEAWLAGRVAEVRRLSRRHLESTLDDLRQVL